MTIRLGRSLRVGVLALAALTLPIAGCSSMAGLSSYGSNKLAVAEISDIGTYTPEAALSQARAKFRNNEFGYSAAYYKRVVELSPNQAEGYVGLSASYDRLGRFDLSDRVYASLYKLTGGTAQYFNNVGYSYMLRGNFKQAYDSFRKARSIDPDNLVVANNLQLLANAAAAARA